MSADHAKALADSELLIHIGHLETARHLGTWRDRELSIYEAEARRRKLKRRASATANTAQP